MDYVEVTETIKKRIENYNTTINHQSEEIHRLKNEQQKLLDQKKQVEVLRNQEKLAQDRSAALEAEIKKIKEANEALKRDLA